MLRKQAGDTIIEVLIAIVVIASVLAGAYASSRRSLNNTFQSKERDEAVKLVQSQIELIRVHTDLTKSETNFFCLVNTDNPTEIKVTYAVAFSVPTQINQTNFSSYNRPACIRTSADEQFDPADPDQRSIPYYLSIKRNPSGGAGPADQALYSIVARWQKVGGGVEQVRLLYRAY